MEIVLTFEKNTVEGDVITLRTKEDFNNGTESLSSGFPDNLI
jgi:hypothetical protein